MRKERIYIFIWRERIVEHMRNGACHVTLEDVTCFGTWCNMWQVMFNEQGIYSFYLYIDLISHSR